MSDRYRKAIHIENKHSKIQPDPGHHEGMKRVWFFLAALVFTVYVVWRILKTIPTDSGAAAVIFGVLFLLAEAAGLFELLFRYRGNIKDKKPEIPKVPVDYFPDIDILINACGQPVNAVYKTIVGCFNMDYPDPDKVHVYVLDDMERDGLSLVCDKQDVELIVLEEDEDSALTEKIRKALADLSSPYFAVFDANTIPRHEFLMHTVPYFAEQEMKAEKNQAETGNANAETGNAGKGNKDQIGCVQTLQGFYNPDLLHFNLYRDGWIPNGTEYLYREIREDGSALDNAAYGGANSVVSRKAYLRAEELAGHTLGDGYGLGIAMQKAGYRCLSTDEILALGLSAVDFRRFLEQNRKFAGNVIRNNREQRVMLSSAISSEQKMNSLASEISYAASVKRLLYFLSPLLFSILGVRVIREHYLLIMLCWLMIYLVRTISVRMMNQNLRSVVGVNVYETAMFPYMLDPVVEGNLSGILKKPAAEKQLKEMKIGGYRLYALPFVCIGLLTMAGMIRLLVLMFSGPVLEPLLYFLWSLYNLALLLMACFFTMGRVSQRKYERIEAVMDCQIEAGGAVYQAKTKDISEEGIAIIMDMPVFIANKIPVYIDLSTDRYEVRLKCLIAHVDQREMKWQYSFRVVDYCDTYEDYLLLVYDRFPSHTNQADDGKTRGRFRTGSLIRNMRRVFNQNRQAPRVLISEIVKDTKGNTYSMNDFNYQYCTLTITEEAPEKIDLMVNGVWLDCRKVPSKRAGLQLYKVENYEAIHKDKILHKKLEKWTVEHWTREADLSM